jgi:hypothetical protein
MLVKRGLASPGFDDLTVSDCDTRFPGGALVPIRAVVVVYVRRKSCAHHEERRSTCWGDHGKGYASHGIALRYAFF